MDKITNKTDRVILTTFALIVVFVIGYALWLNASDPIAVSSSMNADLSVALEESGADFVVLSAQCWEQIDAEFHDGGDMAMYYENIREVLGDDDLLSFDEYDDDGYAGFSIGGVTEQGYTLSLVVQSMGHRNTEDETYIIAEISDERDGADMTEMRHYLDAIFAAVDCKCEPSFMIEGTYDEILSKREKKQAAKRVLKWLNAKSEDKVSDGSYVSYSGYTDLFPYSLFTDKGSVNLQAALSDNEEEGNTHIYIGTPVVFTDF
ncbi:MAG: YwmB family TATA-box binding protein [Firmicutes bacterium]|nr:YwmB family TATA-box binding protein [Bacillota bacterium]